MGRRKHRANVKEIAKLLNIRRPNSRPRKHDQTTRGTSNEEPRNAMASSMVKPLFLRNRHPDSGHALLAGESHKNTTLYVHGAGFASESAPVEPWQNWPDPGMRNGLRLRGMGRHLPCGKPGKPSAKSSYFGNDFKEAFLAIPFESTSPGPARSYDLLCMVDYCPDHGGEIDVIAVGSAGPIALHAAALDKRIRKLTLEKS